MIMWVMSDRAISLSAKSRLASRSTRNRFKDGLIRAFQVTKCRVGMTPWHAFLFTLTDVFTYDSQPTPQVLLVHRVARPIALAL